MNMVLLASMGQANECGSLGMMENSTYTRDLVRALESAPPVSCKTSATSIDSFRSNNQLGRSAESKK